MWTPPPLFNDATSAANVRELADLVIPILAAAVAALVVVWQIRQTDRHRVEDRKALAIIALTRMLFREVELASTDELWKTRALRRFQNGELLIEAYSMLEKEDYDVGRWIAGQRDRIMPFVDASPPDPAQPKLWGPQRAEASKIAAEAAQQLLEWQRGAIKSSWFSSGLTGPTTDR